MNRAGPPNRSARQYFAGLGIALGAGFGLLFGLLLGNLMLGVGIGTVAGLLVGILIDHQQPPMRLGKGTTLVKALRTASRSSIARLVV